ncbi:similar to AflR [Plenodomus lingam JN3]|uniref:Similar to AflR n=1 Tax=Leptosphaeria maculans (strain JN3 / isolate v23.1.3 / race Av1-4-5-6-7-8) TaxID=985895 RepID=E5A5R9_LEPMJ|nr:similar to AflR [Plenodomus lingam JN3]CBX98967.1 similar to AflR [Plenodomus lingam JN3]
MVEEFLDPQPSPLPQLQQQQRPFRESCQNCADSKVRCSKNKPTCARCARRGTPCVYQQSRRAGRKVTSNVHAKQTRRAATETLNENPPADTWAGNVDNNSSLRSSPGSETISTVVISQGASTDSQALSESSSALGSVPDRSGPTEWSSNELFKALCTESAPLLCGDDLGSVPHIAQDSFTLDDQFWALGNASDGTIFDDPTLAFLGLPSPRPEAAENSLVAAYRFGETTSSISTCSDGCPAVISRLLSELFVSCGTTCERNQTQSAEHQSQSLVDIIARNKRISEAMDAMVECTCGQDVHMLFLVGLCTSKVMSYYLEATRLEYLKSTQKPGDSFNTNEDEHTRPEEEDDDVEAKIMSARMVLGELHRIQRLLARLSDRLKQTEPRSDLLNGSADLGDSSRNELETPFTRSMLEQLDYSLRAHLRYVFTCMSRVAQRA